MSLKIKTRHSKIRDKIFLVSIYKNKIFIFMTKWEPGNQNRQKCDKYIRTKKILSRIFCISLQDRWISKERTEGGLNKRASPCALLFSTLLVFPNWTKSRPVYGDSNIHLFTWLGHSSSQIFSNPLPFPGLLGISPPFPQFCVSYILFSLDYALLFLYLHPGQAA